MRMPTNFRSNNCTYLGMLRTEGLCGRSVFYITPKVLQKLNHFIMQHGIIVRFDFDALSVSN